MTTNNSYPQITLNPTDERCKFCDAPIPVARVENGLVPVDPYGEPFCSSECVEAHERNQAEADYEHICTPRD